MAKEALNACRHKLYWTLSDTLARVTRPMVRARGEEWQEWTSFDVGGCAETLGAWRKETLFTIANTWLGHWNHPINPFHQTEW